MVPSASQIVSDQRVRKSVFVKFYKSAEIVRTNEQTVAMTTETFLQFDRNPLLELPREPNLNAHPHDFLFPIPVTSWIIGRILTSPVLRYRTLRNRVPCLTIGEARIERICPHPRREQWGVILLQMLHTGKPFSNPVPVDPVDVLRKMIVIGGREDRSVFSVHSILPSCERFPVITE
jgi:hypothetical protein